MAIWKIDPAHSEIKFKVRHLVVSNVTGHFSTFSATVEAEKEDFSDAKIQFEADVNTIDTNNEQRDGHLKSPDFFDAASHPSITFVSKSVTRKTDKSYEVVGDLTIRGVTRQIALVAEYNGTVKGFGGTEVVGFSVSGKLNRFDYGLQWNALTETGGVVVSDEVRLEIEAEFNKAAGAKKAA